MEDVYDALAERALSNSQAQSSTSSSPSPPHRYIIGIAGAPGSGKSTLATEVCRRINHLAAADVAVNVPMDGFHYFRRELDQMPNPAEAHARRGAHWTFDAAAYVTCLKNIKTSGGSEQFAPSFDHGTGDPVPHNVTVNPHHSIVLSEGNYLLLDEAPWNELVDAHVFDDTWFVECLLDVAMQRVFHRQTRNGTAAEVSLGRIQGNDRPNGELVEQTKSRAAVLVPSLPLRKSEE